MIIFCVDRYFGAAKDLPGVRELFEQERKYAKLSLYLMMLACFRKNYSSLKVGKSRSLK